jgi:hypothetical protein
MTNLDKKVAEIEKSLKASALPEKIEFMNFPIWETVYKSYKSVDNVISPNRDAGIDFLQSKLLNVPVKYIGLGLIALKLLMGKK